MTPAPRRALLRLAIWWLGSVALALPFMADRRAGVVEAVIALAWLVPLLWSEDVRRLLAGAPRIQVWAVGLMFTVWFHAQLRDERMSFFPLVSWYMYGEPRTAPGLVAHPLQGEPCRGGAIPLSVADILPRHGEIRIRVQAWHRELEGARTAADSTERAVRLDDVLRRLGRTYNEEHRDEPLCGLSLLRLTATLEGARSGRLRPAVTARHVDLR